MSKILVTGAKGQLGRSLKKLAGEGFIFTDKEELDITDENAVRDLLRQENFDYLINCAAYTAVDKAEAEKDLCDKINVEAVGYLAKWCKVSGTKLIHISSDYVYHPQHHLPLDEEDECSPQGQYAKSKFESEEVVRNSGVKHLIVRTSWVYSEFGHNFVKTMLRLAGSRSELGVVSDQIGSPTYAGDIAAAILKMIDNKELTGTYNFSNLGFISWADFAEEIFFQSGLDVKINRISSSEYPTAAPRPLNSRLIKSKIADDFQLNLSYWKRSLAKCLQEIDN